MSMVMLEWAGQLRPFDLKFGNVLDIEEACGRVGIGAIYLRLGRSEYRIKEVYHVIRQGLIGGGMKPADADILLLERFDHTPLVDKVELALNILITLMSGTEGGDKSEANDPANPIKQGEWFAALIKLGITPDDLRAMRYDDFISLVNALGADGPEPITEEEFEDILARHDPAALARMKAKEAAER